MSPSLGKYRVQIKFVLVVAFIFLTLIALSVLTTPYMALASFAYGLLCWGLVYRRQREKHTLFMNLGIALDLSLVLLLELQRGAIATAVDFSLNTWQQAHIACSSLAVLLYLPTAYLGWQRYRTPQSSLALREWHKRCGLAAFAFRTLGFILMFSLLSHVADLKS